MVDGTYCGDGLQNLVQMVSVAGFGASLESCLLMKIEKLSTLTPVVGLALDVADGEWRFSEELRILLCLMGSEEV